MQEWTGTTVYTFFSEMSFPEPIVWYILLGPCFLFNAFLMHVSHPHKMINKSSYMRLNCLRKVKRKRKVAAQRRVARVVLRVKKDMWWRMAHGGSGRQSLRELACASLREAWARFCPWSAKIICSPVSGTCPAELSKPCAAFQYYCI